MHSTTDGPLVRLRDAYGVDERDVRFRRLEAPRARLTQDTLRLCDNTHDRED